MNKFLTTFLLLAALAATGCTRNDDSAAQTETGAHAGSAGKDEHGHDAKAGEHDAAKDEHDHDGAHDDDEHDHDATHDDDGHDHDATADKHADDEDAHAHKEDEDDHAHAEGGDGHGHDEHGHDEEGQSVHLTPEQMRTAGIRVSPLQPQEVATAITAPGEVKLDAYRTVQITPRIAAQVVARHARLGDLVETGQPLVTLSSVAMAEAQGELLVASREWARVKQLGRKVVSERRYTEARVNYEQALARVKAYGMSAAEIDALLAGRGNGPDGTFQLVSPQAGRVLHDDFIVGQRVEPGAVLMVIADESLMWVEARIRPELAARIAIGAPAEVRFNGTRLPAKVVQIHHAIDETTRTLAIRLEVDNADDRLHPGMFVDVAINTQDRGQALVLPEEAVLRSPDGDWQVFVQGDAPGEFRPVEVKVLRIVDGKAAIAGIAPGTPVVTAGAFFVQSEIAKSGFEIHNH